MIYWWIDNTNLGLMSKRKNIYLLLYLKMKESILSKCAGVEIHSFRSHMLWITSFWSGIHLSK